MLTQIIEFLQTFAGQIVPIVRCDPWEGGVVLRFSKPHRDIGCGWNWKWPFIERAEITPTATTTSKLPAQSLTTSDGHSVVIEAVVRYNISDVRKFLLGVLDRADAINDTSMGVIGREIRQRTWDECCDLDGDDALGKQIERKVRQSLKRWGVEVEAVNLTTLAKMRSIRVIGEFGKQESE